MSRTQVSSRRSLWRGRFFAPASMRTVSGVGPDFLCVGMQKAGTGWLYRQLRKHPDFCMPPVKELHYFDRVPEQREGMRRLPPIRQQLARWNDPEIVFLRAADWISWRAIDIDEYARLFNFKGGRLSGDITPAYSTLDATLIKKIMARFPDLRVVFLVRDPVERFWSALSMAVRKGRVAADNTANWQEVLSFADLPQVRARSYPTEIAERWQRFVPAGQFGIFFFDDLIADPDGLRERILRFLGGDARKSSGRRPPSFNYKASDKKQAMSDAVRSGLIERFRDELSACASVFGGPAADWPRRYGL